ncbi:hypothetical protein [Chondromyces crocatus]|uniref:Uncharacterized protein n=1 Tax=Chondromyces crocatus TaxID=52 RepID=A0A0K1EG08_CHOCO|nr:hypothetical protein [Chondromyces crocatus]AKT39612.1 uncharacterized protein CMC5_037610 [Chondromyces crocatus]
MSIRIRAVCTKSVLGVTAESLREGIAARLPTLATYYGESEPSKTIAGLSVSEGGGVRGESGWMRIQAGDAAGMALVVDWIGEGQALKDEIQALLAGLDDCEEEDAEEVRDCLSDAVGVARVTLDVGAVEGIGWPLAIAIAATLADEGEGLIQADGEGWMTVDGSGVEQLIDAD